MNWEVILPIIGGAVLLAVVLGNKSRKRQRDELKDLEPPHVEDPEHVGSEPKPPPPEPSRPVPEPSIKIPRLKFAKWFGAPDLAPDRRIAEATWYTDHQIRTFLDEVVAAKANAVLLKTAGFPIWAEPPWAFRVHWFLSQCMQRDIWVQINVGPDFWGSNHNGTAYARGVKQRLNWWVGGTACLFYIKQVVQDFAKYEKVFWELGNEMGHSPAPGRSFLAQAGSYMDMIKRYDNRPVGVSEHDMWTAPVEILSLHEPALIPSMADPRIARMWMMNELAGTASYGWKDEEIRKGPPSRWIGPAQNCWSHKAQGVSAATWLNIETPINDNVRAVLKGIHEPI